MALRSFFMNPPGWLKPLTVGAVCALMTGIAYGFGMFLFPMVMPEMIDLAAKINLFMPHYVLQRAEALLNKKGKDISIAKIPL